MRTCVVVNPRSQGGQTERRWGALADVIRQHYGPFEARFTRGPGDGAAQARAALEEGFELVVAMGGDGTISEVADGFVDRDGKPLREGALLGVLPAGTGGDFRRTIGMPKTLPEAAAALRGHKSARIDLGRLEFTDHDGQPAVRHFINIASFGIGGVVDELVNQGSKLLGGRLSFMLATLQAQARFQNQRVRMRLDDGPRVERVIHNVAVANGRFFGGGMMIAPEAKLDDGRFDVVELGDFSRLELLTGGMKVYRGTHLGLPKVTLARAQLVEAEPGQASERVLLDVDGEQPGRLPARFRLLPGVLRLKLPE
ncbi:MAG TPA: diacylglycerol kinase family protein [Polyangia bacterium]|nr:diacylglycerol kinase family protein [Polyangia bacterium]